MFALGMGGCEDQPVRPLEEDEEVRWFISLATPVDQEWLVSLRGQIFEPERRPALSWLARRIFGFSDDELTPEQRETFADRTAGFMADGESMKRIRVILASQQLDLGRSGQSGQFEGNLRLPGEALAPGQLRRFETVVLADGRGVTNHLWVYPVEAKGISVISDIDDTIKFSNVPVKEELLANTFLRPFRAVDQMAAVYDRWAGSNAAFHYVSGSPWQLFPHLFEFLESEGFPRGSWHLRSWSLARWSIGELLRVPDSHKIEVIEELLRRLPDRVFVMVGDSGERDPEIYATLARRHPERVAHIFIRELSPDGPDNSRYARVFNGLPAGSWTIFTNASQLPPALPSLPASGD